MNKTKLALLALCAAAALAFTACSSDSDNSNGGGKDDNKPSENEFQWCVVTHEMIPGSTECYYIGGGDKGKVTELYCEIRYGVIDKALKGECEKASKETCEGASMEKLVNKPDNCTVVDDYRDE